MSGIYLVRSASLFAARLFQIVVVAVATCELWTVCHAAEVERVAASVAGLPDVFYIRGPIEPGDDTAFANLSKQVDRAYVFLESPGGDVTTGLSIGSEIAIRGFTTLVFDGSGCHSICAVMWVSGARRYMSTAANISVHAAYRVHQESDGSQTASESGVANAKIGAYLNMVGLSLPAIEYFTMARPEDPLKPITPEIAQMLGIDVFVQDGQHVSTPADRPTPARITRQVTEYVMLSTGCSMLLKVPAEHWEGLGRSALAHGHDLFGGEVFGPLIAQASGFVKDSYEKEGMVRWCIQAEARLRADNLPTGIDSPSFDCQKASTSTDAAVCSSQDLWTMDRAMASLYFFFKNNSSGQVAQDYLATQREWLKRRDRCGDDISCLAERYSSRIYDFGG